MYEYVNPTTYILEFEFMHVANYNGESCTHSLRLSQDILKKLNYLISLQTICIPIKIEKLKPRLMSNMKA